MRSSSVPRSSEAQIQLWSVYNAGWTAPASYAWTASTMVIMRGINLRSAQAHLAVVTVEIVRLGNLVDSAKSTPVKQRSQILAMKSGKGSSPTGAISSTGIH